MKNYYATYFEENKNDPKKTWKAINEVIKGTKKKQIIAIQTNDRIADNPVEVAELFADHFSNIGKMIQSKIPSDQPSTLEFEDNRGDGHQMNIEPCTTDEVNKIVASVKSNRAGIDGLNLRALKSILPTVVPILVYLINLSFKEGQFPDPLKLAKVVPLPKAGSLTDISNWRPISILPVLSEIYEKAMHKRLYEYLLKCGFLSETQFGFR